MQCMRILSHWDQTETTVDPSLHHLYVNMIGTRPIYTLILIDLWIIFMWPQQLYPPSLPVLPSKQVPYHIIFIIPHTTHHLQQAPISNAIQNQPIQTEAEPISPSGTKPTQTTPTAKQLQPNLHPTAKRKKKKEKEKKTLTCFSITTSQSVLSKMDLSSFATRWRVRTLDC